MGTCNPDRRSENIMGRWGWYQPLLVRRVGGGEGKEKNHTQKIDF